MIEASIANEKESKLKKTILSLTTPIFLLSVLILIFSAVSSQPDKAGAEAEKLHLIFEDYYQEYLRWNPFMATQIGDNRYNHKFPMSIGQEHRAKFRELHTKYLNKILEIDENLLAGNDRLSYDIFKGDMNISLESLRFDDHLLPIGSSQFSLPQTFALMGAGEGIQPFNTVQDYENFLERIQGFTVWVDTAMANMRTGIEKGVVQPRNIVIETMRQLNAHVVDYPEDSEFHRPVENFPSIIEKADKIRLTKAFRDAIETSVVPGYKKLLDFLRDEYLAQCRLSISLSDLPNGREWYEFYVRSYTTTDLTPDEIYEIGLVEVERIKGEMTQVKDEMGFEGSLADFLQSAARNPDLYIYDKNQVFAQFQVIEDKVNAALPQFFGLVPKTDLEIRDSRGGQTAYYSPGSADGSRPGVFYFNFGSAYPAYFMETLFLHEALPGHHFQGAIAWEREDLPMFRRFNYFGAYIEGWGLYCESLGRELGLYSDPYQYLGRLIYELGRASRLVADVGIHHYGWSRSEAVDILAEKNLTWAISEIDRYTEMPGQALAYKIGQLKISELRAKAEDALGQKFDLKAFHDELLKDGPLPLNILEAKIAGWISSRSE